MPRILLASLAALLLLGSAQAQALPGTVTNSGGVTTITLSYPAADLSEDVFPMVVLDQAIAGRTRCLLLPMDYEIPDHEGQPRDIDAITLAISRAMAYQAASLGKPPPAFVDGVREKVQEKLSQEYGAAVQLFLVVKGESVGPAEVATGIPEVE